MLFMFNSFDEFIDISNHPKYHIVVSNFSKYGDSYDPKTIEKDPSKGISNLDPNLSHENYIIEFREQLLRCV